VGGVGLPVLDISPWPHRRCEVVSGRRPGGLVGSRPGSVLVAGAAPRRRTSPAGLGGGGGKMRLASAAASTCAVVGVNPGCSGKPGGNDGLSVGISRVWPAGVNGVDVPAPATTCAGSAEAELAGGAVDACGCNVAACSAAIAAAAAASSSWLYSPCPAIVGYS